MLQRPYHWLLRPNASDEDTKRKELILNVLLLSTACFTGFLTLFVIFLKIVRGAGYTGIGPGVLLTITAVFVGMLIASRKGLYKFVAYVFVSIFFLLLTWPTIIWGVGLPQVMLTYSLLVVMTGVLISSRTAFYMAGLISITLLMIFHLGEIGVITFNQDWLRRPAGYADVIVYCVMFLIIALVSWLSNREIDHSLNRARQSEKELLEERNSLERKVRARTKALEKAHVEKLLDLQRFAEFGRLSSTLLHELANPLTSVSLDLQQLEGQSRSKLIGRVREGIDHLEQYVETARRQLRNESEIKVFDIATEIERIAGFLGAKARAQRVEIELMLAPDIRLRGDSIRFDHIISNLLANAIDAYDDVETSGPKKVIISMAHKGAVVEIIVQDFGRGITEAQMARLFEPFYTTKETSRGTGIGLTITKQAVEEAFQGTITVTHSSRSGTQFKVRLPLT
jgi:signal transduction histidine kinase